MQSITPREIHICKTLNQKRHQDNISLFGGFETAPYWTLADLTIMYPNCFDIHQPISTSVITKINGQVFKAVPIFQNITPQPVHMLNFKGTFNAFVKTAHEIQTVKNGTNQKLSPVVCEYLFSQINGAEFEQAYFICQNQPYENVKAISNLIRFAKMRTQVKQLSENLASVTKHAIGSNLNSYSDIWSFLWCRLFNMRTMDDLRTKYNLKDSESIMEYMTLEPLSYVNNLLQAILLRAYERQKVSIDEIKYLISTVISSDCIAQFNKNYSIPENYTQKNTENSIIAPVNRAKTNFWKEYYPLSLNQR